MTEIPVPLVSASFIFANTGVMVAASPLVGESHTSLLHDLFLVDSRQLRAICTFLHLATY